MLSLEGLGPRAEVWGYPATLGYRSVAVPGHEHPSGTAGNLVPVLGAQL